MERPTLAPICKREAPDEERKPDALWSSRHYDATRFFVTSIDLPLIAQILEASPSEPYVGMTLKLDRMQIRPAHPGQPITVVE